jgi:hypothetical protein
LSAKLNKVSEINNKAERMKRKSKIEKKYSRSSLMK